MQYLKIIINLYGIFYYITVQKRGYIKINILEDDVMNKNVKCVNVSADIGNLTSIGISSKGSCICESRVKKFESGLDDFSQNQKFTFEG